MRTVVLCALAACAPAPVEVAIPVEADTKSVIVALEKRGPPDQILELVATNVDETGLLPAVEDLDFRVRVIALLYRQPLAALGIEAGVQDIAAEAGRALPPHAAGYTAEVSEEDVTDWVPLDEADTALGRVSLPDLLDGCPKFGAESFFVDATKGADFIIGINDSSALVGSSDRKVFLVKSDGTSAPVSFPAGMPLQAATRSADGTLWFAGRFGQLWRGTLQVNLQIDAQQVSVAPSRPGFNWLTVDLEGGIEAYALAGQGNFDLYDGTKWQTLHKFPWLGNERWRGGISRISRGEAFAVVGVADDVAHFVQGRVEHEHPPNVSTGLSTVANIPGLGPVTSSGLGSLFVREGNEWRQLERSFHSVIMDVLLPYEDGIFMAGIIGWTAFYRIGRGLCPVTQAAPTTVVHVAKFGADLLLAGGAQQDGRLPLTILRRVN